MTPQVNLLALSALLAADAETRVMNPRLLVALTLVCDADEPPSVLSLSRALRLSPGQASRMVARLEEMGLVQRAGSKPERLRPTESGGIFHARVRSYVTASATDAALAA